MSISSPALAEDFPFDEDHWTFPEKGFERVTYKGKEAIHFENVGLETVAASFIDGVIEYDVAISSERAFDFLQFRIVDDFNYEEFYFRPHQSGKPDSTQYQPVTNGHTSWQLYHGTAYSAPIAYNFGEWMHVKLVIKGNRMDLYVDSDEPVHQVPNLLREPEAGRIGIAAYGKAHYANVQITQMDNPPITHMEVPIVETAPGIITQWQVSKDIHGEAEKAPTSIDVSGTEWQTAETDARGLLNLAQFGKIEKDSNAIYVRHTIDAPADGHQTIKFGYSDRVRVYANGALVYSGDNGYRTRDFRFLGTIGIFDSVHFPVVKGRNEIVFEVSEAFGGWGIIGQVAP
jgi:hypothetical protein